jgi:pimeloyl-ACP methyl ester carboxylesterase
MLDTFETRQIETGETNIFVRWSGSGSPVLLLHGFPETHLMWRTVAPLLAHHFTVVCADLRGYGGSGCPASTLDHTPYAKRSMARDMVAVMEHLGFPRFSVAGHDRGGRVAYRLALDHPGRVERLAVLDILYPPAQFGSEPTHSSRLTTGPGRCLPSLNHSRNASSKHHLKPLSMMHFLAGELLQPPLARRFVQPMSRRSATLLIHMPSARNIGLPRLLIVYMMRQTAGVGGALPARSWRSGVVVEH